MCFRIRFRTLDHHRQNTKDEMSNFCSFLTHKAYLLTSF